MASVRLSLVLAFVAANAVQQASSFVPNQVARQTISWQSSAHDDAAADTDDRGRRKFFQQIATTTIAATICAPTLASASAAPLAVATPAASPSLSWPLGKVAFSLLPLAGGRRRATVQETVIPDKMWTFDQIQGIVNVNVPVRMTVIKLSEESGGGLWVHNPVAPTKQLLNMVKELEHQHGPVKHIVLGTVALEHKATFGAFSQNYPNATVWLQPGQWAFPVDLPIELLGVTQRGRRLRELPRLLSESNNKRKQSSLPKYSNEPPVWADEIPYEILGPLKFQSVGAFSETAFFHCPTKTLLITDTVCSVTDTPPPIIQEDPRAMLFHARDNIDEVVTDTPETRQKGWRRMVQFGLVFFPSQIDVIPFGEALKEARNIDPSMRNLGYGAVPLSLYPWAWKAPNADIPGFQEISQNGSLFCPPILTKLILDREPQRTLEWVDRVCKRFDFTHVVPSHLNNYVKANPNDFRKAFEVLASRPGNLKPQRALPEDLALLQTASDLLTKYGVVGPSLVCDGEEARVRGRFASRRR